jgi:hypothetical protein
VPMRPCRPLLSTLARAIAGGRAPSGPVTFSSPCELPEVNRGFRIAFSIVASVVVLAIAAELSLTMIGAQENGQTLRSDLAKVRLPSGYHLVTTGQAGGDCTGGECSLTQTWGWAPSSGRSSSAACADIKQALASAFSGADSNTPIPANAACDYYAVIGDLFHPGQGKRTVEAIVLTCQALTISNCFVELTASYG